MSNPSSSASYRGAMEQQGRTFVVPNSRKLVVAENISANGVIEFVDPWFDPGDQDDDDLLEVIRGHTAAGTALLLGSGIP